jgi:hypothetical protein
MEKAGRDGGGRSDEDIEVARMEREMSTSIVESCNPASEQRIQCTSFQLTSCKHKSCSFGREIIRDFDIHSDIAHSYCTPPPLIAKSELINTAVSIRAVRYVSPQRRTLIHYISIFRRNGKNRVKHEQRSGMYTCVPSSASF